MQESPHRLLRKRLINDGTSRLEIGREAFLQKTQEWKNEYEEIIINQLIAMGASCDLIALGSDG